MPVDRFYADASLADLYDVLHRPDRRADFDFYLPMIMSAGAVLDVGCGTGALLHRARDAGHTGWLCGLDPAPAMLEIARTRTDIEWWLGDLSSASWESEFDLVVMTGHAFQVLVADDEVRSALGGARSALRPGGRFAFETRNPLARGWDRWTRAEVLQAADAAGNVIRTWSEVGLPVEGEIVRFTATFTSSAWDRPRLSRSTLRFMDAASLSAFLTDAALEIEEQFGDWDRRPLTDASPEIITIARRRN